MIGCGCNQLLPWKRPVLSVLMLCSFLILVSAERLKRQDKQLILDLHNYYRASVNAANMRRMEWDGSLEVMAQETAESCEFIKERGTNVFYNTTRLPQDMLEVFNLVLEPWQSSQDAQQPILWARTSMVGCGVAYCERFPLEDGDKIFGTRVFVCKYTPTYFSRDDGQLYREGPCLDSTCPTDAASCVQFTGSVGGAGLSGLYCGVGEKNPQVPDDPTPPPRVTRAASKVSPTQGSIAGGNHLTITGKGFSSNQFDGSNRVVLSNGDGNVTCDVISYRSSQERIECVTREAPVKDRDTTYNVIVHSNDGNGFEAIPCSCTFKYRVSGSYTAALRNLIPLASLPGSPVTLNGTFRATGFEDPNDSKDSLSTDKDNEGDDYFTRILIGGRGCNHMKEDGSLYNSSITNNGDVSTIECLPDVVGIVDSHNATVILANRGTAYVSPLDHLVSLDNKLRPYNFQTHADIVEVTPRRGSRLGGTKISVTVSNSLIEYEDDVKVFVGGLACTNVTVFPNQTEYGYGVIECVTGPQPPPSTYYPGGRGTLREVFRDTTNIDTIQARSRSENSSAHERLFLYSVLTPSEFGEYTNFGQRFSGFFVPPKSSLYTFNLRSDDLSRLFLSHNASSEVAERVINVRVHTRHRWDWNLIQYSDPVYLEAGQPYYYVVVSNQGGGPWDVGLGVKLHNSTLIGGLYEGDYEQQQISISSSIIRERHAVSLEVQPLVQRISLQGVSNAVETANASCFVTIDLSRGSRVVDSISISPFYEAKELEQLLNDVGEISALGRVSVRKSGYEGTNEMFWSANMPVEFTVIYVSQFGVTINEMVTLSFSSEEGNFTSCGTVDTNSTQLGVVVAVETTQDLNSPGSFQVGFNVSSRQQRLTQSLSLDASADMLRNELTELLSWGCTEEARIADKTLIYEDYESEGMGRNRDNSTSFCGAYSNRNPYISWVAGDNGGYRLSDRPYICFAHRGVFPDLIVDVDYREITANADNPSRSIIERSGTYTLNERICDPWPFSGIFDADGWTDYQCVNVRECVNGLQVPPNEFVTYDRHTVTRFWFRWRSNFYIDNLAIASTAIEVLRIDDQFPARPNGVVISYFEVGGGILDSPMLIERSSGMNGSQTPVDGPTYSLVVSKFEVEYGVLECGFGMGLLIGHYDDVASGAVAVEQLEEASGPVSGVFNITIGNETLSDINANVSANDLRDLLNLEFAEEGGFTVSRFGSCAGYLWRIQWSTKSGDLPIMRVGGEGLMGHNVRIHIVERFDGGTWIRPLRGDMLRLPETEPQVEVVVNGIPSSCTNKNCSFAFDDSITPTVFSLTPRVGQSGTNITIRGRGFSDITEDVSVSIGGAECELTYVSESELHCTAGLHSAGCYRLQVMIDGVGTGSTNESMCFQYLLSVDSLSPMMGGVTGGHVLTLSGEGFIKFVRTPREELERPFSFLPWFRHGLGVPDIPSTNVSQFFKKVSADPSLGSMEGFDIEMLTAQLRAAYSRLPLYVFIGSNPCIITESSITELSCVPLPSQEGSPNITITVLGQTVTLEGEYSVSTNATVSVNGITPSAGPVTGNRSVLIMGRLFSSDPSLGGEEDSVEVMIGNNICVVEWFNNTHIQCITSRHQPGLVPVLISATLGIAVLESVLPDWNSLQDLFPMFTYRLEVTGISSPGGSVFGGTQVSVSGGAFVEGETEVFLGGERADLVSISMNDVVFVSPSSVRTHLIKMLARPVVVNTLSSSSVTYRFEWDVENISITVGDSVTWDWELELPITQSLEPFLYEIELPHLGSDVLIPPKIGGFSNVGVTSDSLTVTFNEVGIHYFVTDNNIGTGERLFVVVTVREPQAIRRAVEVYVGGFLAQYMPPGGISNPNVNARRRRQAGGCMDEITGNSSSADVLNFDYSPCMTPTVFSVDPQEGTRMTSIFTITGERFGVNLTTNLVTFGGVPCIVETSTDTTITCMLSGEDSHSPPAFTPFTLSLRNTDAGFGNAYVQTPGNATVALYPLIQEILPSEGSIAGGTDIIIHGDTFSFMEDSLMVRIGAYPCAVTSFGYSEIRCQTSSSAGKAMADVQLYNRGDGSMIDTVCGSDTGCYFNYSESRTPMVEAVSPSIIRGPESTTIEISGWGFSDVPSENMVYFDNIPCSISASNETLILCELQPLPAGMYPLSLKVCNLTEDRCFGNASVTADAQSVTVQSALTGITPENGSVAGGTPVTISGYGFNNASSSISVAIGQSSCRVTLVNLDSIRCITTAQTAGISDVSVTIDGSMIENSLSYEYTMGATPQVTSVSPTSGQGNDVITLSGGGLGDDASLVEVFVGGESCSVQELVNATQLACNLGVNFAGGHEIELTVMGIGKAIVAGNVTFTYNLVVSSLSGTSGSITGQNTLKVFGSGFDPSNTTIKICGRVCYPTSNVPSVTEIECFVPPAGDDLSAVGDSLACDVTVESVGMTLTHMEQYVYRRDLTPLVASINDTRGGTEGGTPLEITGSGFTGVATVTIAGSPCVVQNQTEALIECVTNRTGRTVRAKVMVFIEGKGFALSSVEFWYVDLWSSLFTWGGGPLPQEGDFVVIPKGQTLVLDTKTPILSYLLIQGGELIFDREKGDNEVELHTQGALITSGGRLEVGTEDDPFLSRTQIVLYGHVLSTEIPVYGAKTLALRQGEIDLHGRPLNVTWTRLARTAEPTDTEIYLQDYVEWEVGGRIVLSSTSFSQRENEEMEIANIVSGEMGSILTLTEPLQYQHISVKQEIAGRVIETRGEVGYLTRNVVVRGNVNREWNQLVDNCPQVFRPGQFEVQTCFQGRFGAEIVGDQFGSQIMIHAPEQNQGHVTARIEYIEVTHAGQAFRLGRYPIHFHLNGNVSGSYVRGCGIHHTFNRAVTLHTVDYLLVEKNVAYNILGHAYFLEDGIEQNNIIQDNLGVFVRASSSLLNVDITPATFWVVNANNILRRNAAAGGTHFGFWYRLPAHPTGPSFTTSICPRKQRVLEFSGNTAHSFGWYGLWVFRQYFPSPSGACGDDNHAPSYFDNFLSWRNDRGVEFAEVGALQLRNSTMLDNKLAGVEITEIESIWSEENGPLVSNTLIVGYSDISSEDFCTETGIKTPKSYYLTVSGVTFVNFDRPHCYPIRACSHCKIMQGGFETRYKNITFINTGDKVTRWQWEHEHIHRDLDGTLTGSGTPKLLIPTSQLLDPTKCSNHNSSSDGAGTNGTQGSICDGDLVFGRFAVFNPTPSDLEFTPINITNDHGITTLPYVFKRLRGTGPAYMAQLVLNQTYNLVWLQGNFYTNISYNSLISGFGFDDYVIIRHQYPRPLDVTLGITMAVNASVLDNPATAKTGDYVLNENRDQLRYIIKGGNFHLNERENFFRTYRCFYLDCILPTLPPPIPQGRPDSVMMWSNVSIWPNEMLPAEGDNVTIASGMYVIVDVPSLPRLGMIMIEGGLEFLDNMDRTLEADLIIILGGRFVAGYEDTPFEHNLRIILHGNNTSPELLGFKFQAPNIGAKAIAAFGELILNAVPQSSKTWTLLSQTANAGDNQISLVENVDWSVGDTIVITSTSFDAYETEVFEVMSVISSNTLMLNDTLRYTHLGEDETIGLVRYTIRAEVGRLSRKIVIENGKPELANEQNFGCRILVSNSGDFAGSMQLQGVEFKGCGQLGYTDTFDPRFALAMVNTGRQTMSYIRECSFHDGFNTAIGVFGTDGVSMTDNVIHSTVGPSMILDGSEHVVMRNLASLSQFIGTYRNPEEPLNSLWTANYEIADTTRIQFIENHAAGGGKAGIHTDGDECLDKSPSTIQHNVAHSSLHCFHVGYDDGSSAGCSRFANLTAYSCYHYGLFSFSRAGIELQDSTFINNKAAILASVIGPSSLSHQVGTKSVLIERTNIISAGVSFECPQDEIKPAIANHQRSHFGLQTPTGGHVGVLIPTFVSGRGGFPKFPWPALHSYPAISGLSLLSQVSFVNFATRCLEKRDATLMTSSFSEDANHPVHLEGITFESDFRYQANGQSIQPQSKLFVHEPNIKSINPSDCVDMDCDGLKHILIRDLDGSFTEQDSESPRSLVSFAELEWDGDRRRGIGDFRIPKTMLSNPDGSRISVDDVYPQKGILRGSTFGESQCEYNQDWTLYVCPELEHLMLVLESLDEDTEVRRLSPIGLGANGFIDLLNGPMDNGWCGGYTCQERVSTFYGIVAASFNYTIGLTSTNPQNFAIHLLNSGNEQGVVIRIIYNNPQRLDVYVAQNGEDVYIPPMNAKLLPDGNLEYRDLNPGLGKDQFYPVFSDRHGANFYDRSLKQLHINIKGSDTYKIITTPVIMLSLTLSTTVNNFFAEEFLVRNLALLLNIPANRIRVVNVVRESRRKRQAGGGVMETIELEIGDPPTQIIETTVMNATIYNDTNTVMNVTDTTNTTDSLSFEQLADLTEMVAAAVQTGAILMGSNSTSVVSAAIEEPVAPPTDPTGGVRAIPSTGGPQPENVGENSTILTFFQQQQMDEQIAANASTPTVMLSIPSRLTVTRQPSAANIIEGLPLSNELAPIITMLDNNNQISENLGVATPWQLTANIASGPDGGFLTYNAVEFVNGQALFEGMVFSHPGTYILSFSVTVPSTADFFVMSQAVTVGSRSLSLDITQQPQDGNTTFKLFPYPAVRLLDGGVLLQEHTWRNTSWFVTAFLMRGGSRVPASSWSSELSSGMASFTDIKIAKAGDYRIEFEARTIPDAPAEQLPSVATSTKFTIRTPQFTRFIVTYDVDFNSTVNNSRYEFIQTFEQTFLANYPGVEIYNTTISEGSIIVSTFVTARDARTLVNIINQVTTDPNTTLKFVFNGVTLVPSMAIQDPAFPVSLDGEDYLILILATTIPAGVILLCGLLLICVVCICQKRRKHKEEFKIKVFSGFKDTYVNYNAGSHCLLNGDNFSSASANEYFLEAHEMNNVSTPAGHRKADLVTSSEKVEVPVFHSYVVPSPSTIEEGSNEKLPDGKEDLGNE